MNMQKLKQPAFLEWGTVAIATILMLVASGLILYPGMTLENLLTALRFSSFTTALPFLLLFVLQPLARTRADLREWLQHHHRNLWWILTISHLIHLYQIVLFYQLGKSCPWVIWLITSPLWIIMVTFSLIELRKPQLFDQIYQASAPRAITLLHGIGIWYIWVVFTLAFGLGAIAHHIPFYNLPAFVLFLAGAIVSVTVWWKRRIAASHS